MILDYGHDNISHMMDWGSNGWIYMILGGIFFLLIVVILLYLLSRGFRQNTLTNTLNYEAYGNPKISSVKENGEKSNETTYFCPSCGVNLDGRTSKFCPICGSKI
ncbi:MAG: hypothetical protein ACFFCL_14765 [Promethearchaeota archaeon]